MADDDEATVSLELRQGYQFLVDFGMPGVPGLLMDEPGPLGAGQGPNASRMLAAAIANCLSAMIAPITKTTSFWTSRPKSGPCSSCPTTPTCSQCLLGAALLSWRLVRSRRRRMPCDGTPGEGAAEQRCRLAGTIGPRCPRPARPSGQRLASAGGRDIPVWQAGGSRPG